MQTHTFDKCHEQNEQERFERVFIDVITRFRDLMPALTSCVDKVRLDGID